MQFSKLSVSIISLGVALAAPITNLNITETANGTELDVPGLSQGVEFPFSDDAIIEAVQLGSDIAPIVLDDSVFFVNTTLIEEELSQLSKRDADANADAWRPHHVITTPGHLYKRDSASDSGIIITNGVVGGPGCISNEQYKAKIAGKKGWSLQAAWIGWRYKICGNRLY